MCFMVFFFGKCFVFFEKTFLTHQYMMAHGCLTVVYSHMPHILAWPVESGAKKTYSTRVHSLWSMGRNHQTRSQERVMHGDFIGMEWNFVLRWWEFGLGWWWFWWCGWFFLFFIVLFFCYWLDGLILDVMHAMRCTDSPSTFPLRSVGLFGVGVRGFVSPTPLRSVCVGVLFVVPSRVWNSTGVPQYPARGDFYFVLCGCVWGWGGVGCLVCVVWWSCASVFFPLICACWHWLVRSLARFLPVIEPHMCMHIYLWALSGLTWLFFFSKTKNKIYICILKFSFVFFYFSGEKRWECGPREARGPQARRFVYYFFFIYLIFPLRHCNLAFLLYLPCLEIRQLTSVNASFYPVC